MKSTLPYAYVVVCAIILLSAACADDPFEVHYNRALDYEAAGEYRLAIQEYDRAIELDPNYVDAYVFRGYSYERLGFELRAIEDFDKAIELDSNHAVAFNNRGMPTTYWMNSAGPSRTTTGPSSLIPLPLSITTTGATPTTFLVNTTALSRTTTSPSSLSPTGTGHT